MPKKRIAIFIDGTWNKLTDNTNVWRLKSLCAPVASDGTQQLIYYNTGLGTKKGESVRGGIVGYGMDDAIIDAYGWLAEHYEDGDDVFIFGFSRGAYTARGLAGLVAKFGLLTPGAPLSLRQLYDRYKVGGERTIRDMAGYTGSAKDKLTREDNWLLKYSRPINIEFIGVWDTVGAISKSKALFIHTGLRKPYKNAYHAIAIDENRRNFAPTLWTYDRPSEEKNPVSPRPFDQCEQRWFVGAHGNVGGGYANDLLAQLPLNWLMEKAAKSGLVFRNQVDVGDEDCACPITDSYAEFGKGFYKYISRRFWREISQIPQDDGKTTRRSINESIDGSVFERWRRDKNYRPKNLVAWGARYKVDPSTIKTSVMADSLGAIK
ncbi:uncharacterized protein (DUF2235 family) [Afipia massiliensis]|uniref:Uncharacterized protein (DUF2235 family) n=1 Tax=Afipia massiliensis TaxID=211460 RepID=A0A840MZ04_9BRAD|nr:uncharacterized protein (DUF2235 family) [Afipia massiliensis]